MIVKELKEYLDTLPDDMKVCQYETVLVSSGIEWRVIDIDTKKWHLDKWHLNPKENKLIII